MSYSFELLRRNAEESLALATALFSHEVWIPKEANIWVAKSRLVEDNIKWHGAAV
jgi:hypothetical protein